MPQRRVIKQIELFPCSKVCSRCGATGGRDMSAGAHERPVISYKPATHIYVDSTCSELQRARKPMRSNMCSSGVF